MTEQPTEALRKALDEMDMLRKRSIWISQFLAFCSIAFLFPAFAIFLFKQEVWLGMPFAVCSLFAAIFGCAIRLGGSINENTQRILLAIYTSKERPPRATIEA